MTQPVDITDPTIAKAYAHPLRIEILALLDNRVASPTQLATELGASLPTTSYHVRQLDALKLIRLVKRRQKRGSIEHFYTAAVRPTIHDDTWARTPRIVKRAIIGGRLAQVGKEVVAAAEAGGFDQEDIHLSRSRLRLTQTGWKELSEEMLAMLERVDRIADEDAARLGEDPDAETKETTAVMMLFESPPPCSFDSTAGDALAGHDELEDVAHPASPQR